MHVFGKGSVEQERGALGRAPSCATSPHLPHPSRVAHLSPCFPLQLIVEHVATRDQSVLDCTSGGVACLAWHDGRGGPAIAVGSSHPGTGSVRVLAPLALGGRPAPLAPQPLSPCVLAQCVLVTGDVSHYGIVWACDWDAPLSPCAIAHLDAH